MAIFWPFFNHFSILKWRWYSYFHSNRMFVQWIIMGMDDFVLSWQEQNRTKKNHVHFDIRKNWQNNIEWSNAIESIRHSQTTIMSLISSSLLLFVMHNVLKFRSVCRSILLKISFFENSSQSNEWIWNEFRVNWMKHFFIEISAFVWKIFIKVFFKKTKGFYVNEYYLYFGDVHRLFCFKSCEKNYYYYHSNFSNFLFWFSFRPE